MTRWKIRHLIGIVAGSASLWLTVSVAADMPEVGQLTPGVFLPYVARSPDLTDQECPAWVHDRHITAGPDGKTYPTWHPPIDPIYQCYFSHEHGSDPRLYVGFAGSGMPAFGYAGAQAGMNEPHNGFKVYVSNDDWHGHAWLIVLHQGTGGPKRATTQHHSLDWHLSATSGDELIDIQVMADFGLAGPNCRLDEAIPGTGYGTDRIGRIIPTTDCAAETPYEIWITELDVAGVFEASPIFDIDNPTTVVNAADLNELRFMCEFRSPEEDCASADTQWTGNKRGVSRPGQYVHNGGSPQFYTDAFGRRVAANTPGAIGQFITDNGWDTRDCCGKDVEFRIQTYSNGVYIVAPAEPAGLAVFGVDKHHWPN